MQRLSIRDKLLLLYLAVVLPLAAISGLGIYERYDGLIRGIYEHRRDAAELVATNMAGFVDEVSITLNTTGFAITRPNMQPESITPYLATVKANYPSMMNVTCIDPTGKVTASLNQAIIGKSIKSMPLFNKIVAGENVAVSDYQRNITGDYGFVIASAVRENGRLVAIMVATIDPTKLATVVPTPKTGGSHIVDSNGMLVYQNEHPDIAPDHRDWSKYGIIKEARSGKIVRSDNFISRVDNKRHFIVEAPIRKLGWTAGSDVDVESALANVNRDVSRLLTLSVLVFILVSGLSFFIGTTISRPLAALAQRARLLGEEKFDDPINTDAGGEILTLANELDGARAKLLASFKSLNSLLEASSSLNTSLDIKQVTGILSDSLMHLIDLDTVAVSSFDDDTNTVTVLNIMQNEHIQPGDQFLLHDLPGVYQQLYAEKEPIFIDASAPDIAEDARAFYQNLGIKNVLLYPLHIGERIIGHITLEKSAGNQSLSPEDLKLIESIAAQATIAIENARLFSEVSLERARFQGIFEQALDGITIIDGETGYFMNTNPAFQSMLDFAGHELRHKHIWELHPKCEQDSAKQHFEGAIDRESSSFSETRFVRKNGSAIDVEINLRVVELAGRKVALASIRDITTRKRTEQNLKTALGTTRSLLEVSQAISSNTELIEMASTISKLAASVVGVKSADIYLIDEAKREVELITPGTCQTLQGTRFKIKDAGIFKRVYDGFEVSMNSTLNKSAGIPLISRGKTIGGIFFSNPDSNEPVAEDSLELARGIARQVAVAIDNAKRYEQERDIADTLQQALLSIPLSLPGIKVSHLYESAMEVARVGGDFYDLFELDGSKIGFAIGDVSGKGLEAATITSVVKSTIRAFALKGLNSNEVFSETNNAICRQINRNQFVTAIFGIIDTRSGAVEFTHAGHPDMIICTRQSECALCTAERNPPLGAFPGLKYEGSQTRLEPGDTIVLYTDGLIEAKRGKELYGDTRAVEAIKTIAPAPGDDIIDGLISSAKEFAGGNLLDDVAILALTLTDELADK